MDSARIRLDQAEQDWRTLARDVTERVRLPAASKVPAALAPRRPVLAWVALGLSAFTVAAALLLGLSWLRGPPPALLLPARTPVAATASPSGLPQAVAPSRHPAAKPARTLKANRRKRP